MHELLLLATVSDEATVDLRPLDMVTIVHMVLQELGTEAAQIRVSD